MANGSVQFRDVDTAMEAFSDLGLTNWSLSQGSQLLVKYQGTDETESAAMLRKWLDRLVESESAAMYTVKFYELLKKGEPITSKTPYSYSFNLRFLDQIVGRVPGTVPMQYGANGLGLIKHVESLTNEVGALKETLQLLIDERQAEQEAKAQEPPAPSVGQVMFQQLTPLLLPVVQKIIDGLVKPANPEPHAISGLSVVRAPGEADQVGKQADPSGADQAGKIEDPAGWFNQTDADRIYEACVKMKSQKIDVPDLLERLAKFATNKPTDFATYMNLFKSIS